jgi:hypothetical protein
LVLSSCPSRRAFNFLIAFAETPTPVSSTYMRILFETLILLIVTVTSPFGVYLIALEIKQTNI